MSQTQNDRVTISAEVLNRLLTVLGSLPYVQVAEVIQATHQDVRPLVQEVETSHDNKAAHKAK